MFNVAIILILQIFSVTAWSKSENTELTIDEKIQAFDEFEQSKDKFNGIRESDLNDLLAERKDQQKKKEKQLEEYLLQKSKEKRVKAEDTPDYEEYLLKKWEWHHGLEKAAEDSIRLKQNLKPGKKARDFEIREYALQDTEKNRIPFNKRKPLGTKQAGSSSSGRFGGGGGGGSSPFIPPPPIEDVPDFDNDIPPPPPPPPPPMGGGEFDDIDPVPIPPPPPME